MCNGYGGTLGVLCLTQHRINAEVVLTLITDMLRAIADYSKNDRAAFVKAVMEAHDEQQYGGLIAKRKRLITAQERAAELEMLLRKIYEDICCKGRKSNPSNTVRAAGSSVAVWAAQPGAGDTD